MAKSVLVVDDEPLIVKGLKFSLEQDGYEVTPAYDGEDAIKKFFSGNFDIVLLDVMLPGISGTEVCRRIREASMVPIIMLTAKSDDMDKIMGLEFGADDYITKPFNILELKVRMKNFLRRASENTVKMPSIITVKNMVVDREKRSVYIHGKEADLTAKEFDILLLLITNPGKVYKREDLLKLIWHDYSGDIRTVDVHIRRLRKKIEASQDAPEYIYTKWGLATTLQKLKPGLNILLGVTYVLIVVAALAIITLSVTTFVGKYFLQQRADDQKKALGDCALDLTPYMADRNPNYIYEILSSCAIAQNGRILFIDNNGIVQVDTFCRLNGTHPEAEEIRAVLEEGADSSMGYHVFEINSRTVTRDNPYLGSAKNKYWAAYYTQTVITGGEISGVLLLSSPVQDIVENTSSVSRGLMIFGAVLRF